MLNFKKNNFLATILTLLFIPYVYSQDEINEISTTTQEERIAEVMSVLLANGLTAEEATDLVNKALNTDRSQVLEDFIRDHANNQKPICSEPSTIPETGINLLNTGAGNCNYPQSDYDGCNIKVHDMFGDYTVIDDGSFRMTVLEWVCLKIGPISSVKCEQTSLCGGQKTCKSVISSDNDGQWMECNCR